MSRQGSGLSEAARRAQQLLIGGAVGGHIAAVVAVGALFVTGGAHSAVSAAVGAAVALLFYIVGLAVQVGVADSSPERVLFASLLSFGSRAGLLGVLVIAVGSQPALAARLEATPLVIGVIAVVIGWLAAEIRVFSRLRIPVFDPPADPPSAPQSPVHPDS